MKWINLFTAICCLIVTIHFIRINISIYAALWSFSFTINAIVSYLKFFKNTNL